MDFNELEIGGIIKKFKHRTILSEVYLKCKTGGNRYSRKKRIGYSHTPSDHIEYKIINEVPSYTYKVKKGVSHDRAGLLIIKGEGILDIINDAADQVEPSPI